MHVLDKSDVPTRLVPTYQLLGYGGKVIWYAWLGVGGSSTITGRRSPNSVGVPGVASEVCWFFRQLPGSPRLPYFSPSDLACAPSLCIATSTSMLGASAPLRHTVYQHFCVRSILLVHYCPYSLILKPLIATGVVEPWRCLFLVFPTKSGSFLLMLS